MIHSEELKAKLAPFIDAERARTTDLGVELFAEGRQSGFRIVLLLIDQLEAERDQAMVTQLEEQALDHQAWEADQDVKFQAGGEV